MPLTLPRRCRLRDMPHLACGDEEGAFGTVQPKIPRPNINNHDSNGQRQHHIIQLETYVINPYFRIRKLLLLCLWQRENSMAGLFNAL